jgi:carbamoyltransferase
MGLAPYGQPKYVDIILSELMDLRADGSFRLNQKYFNYTTGLTMVNGEFSRMFGGPAREPESPLTQREMDLARSIQEVCEEVMLRMARAAHRETGMKNLCMAGGVALNCVANGRVLREGPFEQIWIQPAAGDAGGALGIAQLIWHRHFEAERAAPDSGDSMGGAYLGPSFSADEIESFLHSIGVPYQRLEPAELIARVAQLLAEEKVIGWFDGRMEFGPRALGAPCL